ncbi:vps901 protein, putative, partial [Perkinsus marinus ATCC 50983]
SKYRAPRDKLVCLLNCCRVITRTLESSDGGSADDILPILIWVLIKARPSRLRSNINFIQAF